MRYFAMLVAVVLVGCANKYDDCVDQQKEEFRQKHPGASFALITSKQRDFEMMCSNLKGK